MYDLQNLSQLFHSDLPLVQKPFLLLQMLQRDPKHSPDKRLIIPIPDIAIVISGFFGINFIHFHRCPPAKLKHPCLYSASLQFFSTSAPNSCILHNRRIISSFVGVLKKIMVRRNNKNSCQMSRFDQFFYQLFTQE